VIDTAASRNSVLDPVLGDDIISGNVHVNLSNPLSPIENHEP